ncbi:MAG TPA: DUF1015 domain-containing protein [Candidatus Deferrimicrobiaceae bacterium]|nr:DUF1015 domain-containing protein [Candidatus Deferrimicrobiaceae bacterium]
MPTIRPFRALRYSPEVVPDLGSVVAPPYDVIDASLRRRLGERDPRNVVHVDLPVDEPSDPPDERYRRAARILTSWRGDGTLHRDPRPAVYPYEQIYVVPGTDRQLTRRGVFARVGLESFGPQSGVRAHERTLSGPKEDRYRLLRATGVNTSPVVGLYEDSAATVPGLLAQIEARPPAAEVTDDDGVEHRLWVVPAGEDELGAIAEELCRRIGAGAITIADGHHRYETALRYASERQTGHVADDDEPAWSQVLMLLLEPVAGPLTVLATHRVVVDLDDDAVRQLVAGLPELFEVAAGVDRAALVASFGAGDRSGGGGRFGLWTRGGGALLKARREAFEAWLPPGGPAVRRLDVTLAGIALERLGGLDAAAVAEGRLAFTRDADEAIAWVESGSAGAALLLEPTPASEILAVAADGDVMPQKSTYIYPKALTGLVLNPLE